MTRPDQIMESNALEESVAADETGWRSRIVQYLDVSTILRLCGSGFTIAAILLFLFQRWENASDLHRYGMILGETLTLTLLGLMTSRWLKEQKSARVFLSLSLVSTSAVFTILGAMIYSQVQWMPTVTNVPDFAFWAADSMDTVLLLLVGSFVILGGQSLLSFSVLARPVARSLTLLLMLNIGLLLLPVRDLGITTLLVMPVLLFVSRYLAMLRKSTPAMRTGEGTMAGILVLLPLVIMVGRGAYLYAEGPVAIGSLALLAYLVLRQLALSISNAVRSRKFLEMASLAPAALAALELTEVVNGISPRMDHWLIVVFAVAMSGFLLDLARRALAGNKYYLRGMISMGLIVAVVEQAFWPGVSTAMLGVVLSGLLFVLSYSVKEVSLFGLSLLTLIGSLVLLVVELIATLNTSTWVSMAILGMSTIILAAAVERYGKQMVEVARKLT
jgi:hypothetical protein